MKTVYLLFNLLACVGVCPILAQNGNPKMSVEGQEFQIHMEPNEVFQMKLPFWNEGKNSLEWRAEVVDFENWVFLTGNTSGNLDPKQSSRLDINFDAFGLSPGYYFSEINLYSNDPEKALLTFPLHITITQESEPTTLNIDVDRYEICQGHTIDIEYSISGLVNEDNEFTIELSDSHGEFGISFPLEKIVSGESRGTLSATMPTGIVAGHGYKIRVRMNSPYSISNTSNPLAVPPFQRVDLPEFQPVCITTGFVKLPQVPNVDGTWSGPGVNNNAFMPPKIGLGKTELKYTYTTSEGCENHIIREIEIVGKPEIEIEPLGPFCSNSVGIVLKATPENGYWVGSGIADRVFHPSESGSGEIELTYIYSLNESCTSQKSIAVRVFKKPDVWFKDPPGICAGKNELKLDGGIPEGGEYWGEGVKNGVFEAEGLKPKFYDLHYSYTSPEGCSNSAQSEIEVKVAASVKLSSPHEVCINGETLELFDSNHPGRAEGKGIIGNKFYPSEAGAGKWKIKAFSELENGCKSEQSVVINVHDVPEVSLENVYPICEETPAFSMEYGFPKGGFYSINGQTTTRLDPDILGLGAHDITYIYRDENTCIGKVTRVINIEKSLPRPSLSFDGVMITSTAENEVLWYLDGKLIENEHNRTLLPHTSGKYSCKVSSENCDSPLSKSMPIKLGTIGNLEEDNIFVYPNPFTNKLILETSKVWPEDTEIRLYNDAGRLVYYVKSYELKYSNGKYMIGEGNAGQKLSALKQGQYYLIVMCEGKMSRTIVQRGE